jgi:hypothetical protein
MGLKKPLPDDVIKKLYCEDGMQMRNIADQVGCSAATICYRLKKMGVQARSPHDYPATEKQMVAWTENGKKHKGKTLSAETKAKMSASKKGRRKRTDYEFGGHEKKRTDGYIRVYVPDHPNCSADGFVMKHILVVERNIGRYLTKDECVHHINRIRDDNRLENLKLMTKKEHMSMHMKERHSNRGTNVC